jgi:hypothetical protein
VNTRKRSILGYLALLALATGLLAQSADAGIQRYLRVHNCTKKTITVKVNFGSGPTVGPGQTRAWHVGDSKDKTTFLDAYTAEGVWIKRSAVPGHLRDFDWYIYSKDLP